ncbi:putative protein phosphatase 2A, regulatory B subunit, B56, armadillo-like helical [Plasmopara halstedii]
MPVTNTSFALPSHVLEDTDWKLQRKLKHHHRDAGRRMTENRAEPRFKHHGHHQRRANSKRHEVDVWLPQPAKNTHSSYSDQLPHQVTASTNRASQLSRSGPSATSWPPSWTSVAETMDLQTFASSAPSIAYIGMQDENRREIRPMTLFESARIFNESGELLSHDNFDELELASKSIADSTPKRKMKRRVGRRKHETKRMVDVLSIDEVVLELMCLLFPDIEVTQELNLLFLGGAQHEDVFHFDEDEDIGTPAFKPKSSVLDVDLLQFQAALTKMLFNSFTLIQQMLARGSTAETLQRMLITPQWIAREMLVMVKLDLRAQYDRFAVISAIFRMISALRPCILAAATATSLAIYEHQSLINLDPGSDGKELITVKGMLAFLNAAMDIIERDARYNVDVFGSTDIEVRDAISDMCSQITRAIRLLVRSSPGGNGISDANRNQLEKYAESSESAEATTYRAMGELLNRMTFFFPKHGENFLRWMMLKWPQRNFMVLGLMLPADVIRSTFTRMEACIQSMHFLVAQEACLMCGNFQLMSMYLSRDRILREKIASALHTNVTSHWNKRIREISDEYFDMLLDLA